MSVYVGPYSMCQVMADTPEELYEVIDRLGLAEEVPVKLDPRLRPWVVGLGAIELSRREFAQKCDEIGQFGRGSGPKLAQICR